MTYKIQITNSAKAEMREVYIYIAEKLKNPVAAERRISMIEKGIQSLKENPNRIALVKDSYLKSKHYRMLVVKSHLVFFIVNDEKKTVLIMRVLYARRDWMNLLNK